MIIYHVFVGKNILNIVGVIKMKKILTLFISVLTLVTVTIGCQNKQAVSVEGSTSMEKVIGALGEVFENENSGITFTYNPSGSGTGITAVSEGRCDIGLSSRNLKQEEKTKGLTQTLLALDGIAVIVNQQNSVRNITLSDLTRIFTGEINNWRELGGDDSEIVRIGREAGSGTRDGFETITDIKDKCDYRQELTSSGDVISTVVSNPNAIGYTSLASVKSSVATLSIDGVSPTESTVKNGSYVIQRPYVLVTKVDAQFSETAQEFFDYITSEQASKIISDAGAVPVN